MVDGRLNGKLIGSCENIARLLDYKHWQIYVHIFVHCENEDDIIENNRRFC